MLLVKGLGRKLGKQVGRNDADVIAQPGLEIKRDELIVDPIH
jgi:hypothetical protein